MIHRPLLLCFGLVLAAPAMAGPICPSNNMNACTIASSILPADSRTCSVCDIYGCSSVNAHYDIPGASLNVSVSVYGEGGNAGGVVVQDDFHVIGVASGTPLTFTAHLLVGLTNANANLTDAFGHTASATTDTNPLQTELTLEVAALAGEPFRLVFELQATGDAVSGTGSGTGHFSFSGIPQGAAVASCNGYVSDPLVPTHVTSWGRLKSMYR